MHASLAQTYAPRPLLLPVGSLVTAPSGPRTTRSSPRLSPLVRQATQVRMGMCLGRMESVGVWVYGCVGVWVYGSKDGLFHSHTPTHPHSPTAVIPPAFAS